MRILLVEDELKTSEYLRKGLSEHGFMVDVARNGEDGLHLALSGNYVAIVLDVMLPVADGWTVLKTLRQSKHTPVLFLTAKDNVEDRVKGLELGADDYLVKPFDISELSARCRALLRRPAQGLTPVLQVGKLMFDTASRRASHDGAAIDLPRREAGLLEVLMRRAGTVLTKQALEEAVYDFNEPVTPNAVEAAISRLRRRLDEAGVKDILHNVRGVGYMMKAKRE